MKKKQLIFTTVLTSLLLASCSAKEETIDKEQNNTDNSFMESEDDSFNSFEDSFIENDVVDSNKDKVENSSDKVENNTDKVENNSDKVENNSDKVENNSDKVENNSNKVENNNQHQNLGPEYEEIPPLPGEEPEDLPSIEVPEDLPPVEKPDKLPPVEENEQKPVEPDFDFTEQESKPDEQPLPETPLPEEDVITFNNSIEIYKASVEKLKNINYSYEGIGFCKPDPLGFYSKLNLHETYSQNDGNIAFVKASSGKAIAGQATTYAKRYNINGDKVTIASANSKKPYNVNDGRIDVNNWSEDVDSTLQDVERDFAKRPGEYIYYAVDLDTVTEDSLLYTVDENGNYHINFTFVFDNNGDSSSKTVNGYGNHISTISEQKFKRCTSSEITLVLDKDLKPISYDLHEQYEVEKSIFTCYIENTINYKFTY